ncbi:cytochrome c assembly protein [Thermodesulfobacterium geofontis OPF15]|jgi:cytochrome c-type biogenesis protein CcsB|uniref:Cytochrome c assembly protein n=1 Tax=Thermodesulfobacterium geofontis (strain OPF15) TaxID=795359 RepID=F8C2X9_THEGP|nr:cytochrome c biogenesis protein CcsA [Thermodesulfobacterium geofontis]AEH22361.1 cytochrome c assembly protein [Thermodesulfobacterium geofontis OPF15]
MTDLFFFLSFFVYLISFIGFGFYFKSLKKEALKYAQLVLLVGFIFHTLFWVFKIFQIFTTSLLSFKYLFNFLSWELVLIYFLFTILPIKIYATGFFLLPIVLILLLLSYFFPQEIFSPFSPHFKSLWFPLHAFTGLFSHGFLLFGTVTSLMYILQEREIKKKHLGLFFRKLPPLEYLDKVTEKCLYLGFIFLSLAMISGAIWSEIAFGNYWRWSPKEVITLILWLIYAVLIHQRVLIGWRGKKASYMFLLGFSIWLISFFVINLFSKGFHTYGS